MITSKPDSMTGTVTHAFWRDLAAALDVPLTNNLLAFWKAWEKAEGSDAKFNPFNSTLKQPGSTDYSDENDPPVQDYASHKSGVTATALTLQDSRHAGILASIKRGDRAAFTCLMLGLDPSWGTNATVVMNLLDNWSVQPIFVIPST